jgi:hypothetical protein
MMQEHVDKASLNTLLYGTGFLKTVWDSTQGKPIEVDEGGNMILEGDMEVSIPSPWRMRMDPDAVTWKKCRYIFEELILPYEEALFRWPDKKPILDRLRQDSHPSGQQNVENDSELQKDYRDVVRVYEYWERGLPVNGYLGRYCVCTSHGELVTEVTTNPFRFPPPGKLSEIDSGEGTDEDKDIARKKVSEIAELPYHVFSDIDVPDQIWGKSFVEYIAELQDMLNRLDSTTLDTVQAHGIARLILPEGAEIADDSITNSTWDFIKITGSQPPHFMETPQLMPEMTQMRQYLRAGIDDISGVNESMFGKQSREQSGFSMQYATNQGNMIRRRLFNKYVMFVESIYKSYLNLVRKHWDIGRIVQVLGNEKQIESVEIKGADIDGGYDLVVEYGSSLSLDPITRREEILLLQPLLEKAGVPSRVILSMLKLNELSNMRDLIQMADDRQEEIFKNIIATREQIQPRRHQDHVNMMAYAKLWFMTKEYDNLDDEIKDLCEEHLELRAQVAAQEQAPGGLAAQPQAPGPAPQGPATSPDVGAPQGAPTGPLLQTS